MQFLLNIFYVYYKSTWYNSIEIRAYWKMKTPKVKPGVVHLPIRLFREDPLEQAKLIPELIREAYVLRIKKKLK